MHVFLAILGAALATTGSVVTVMLSRPDPKEAVARRFALLSVGFGALCIVIWAWIHHQV